MTVVRPSRRRWEDAYVADQVHDAGLDLRLREHGVDGLRETLQAVDHGDQHVLDSTVLQFGHDAQPELSPLSLLNPNAQDFLGAVGAHAQRQIYRLVLDRALVANLNPQRVEEYQWIHGLEWPVLPFDDLVHGLAGDGGDEVG